MNSSAIRHQPQTGPRRRGRRDCDDESMDDAPQLLDDEPGDIEQDNPVEEDELIKDTDDVEENASRAFDERSPGRDEPDE